jgi:hypothetical protein
MGYVTARKARLQQQLTRTQTVLDSLYTSLTNPAMTEGGVKSYAFDSGEGSQRTTYFDLTQIEEMIRVWEAKESHLINELYNMGIVNVRLRRKYPI